MPRPCLPLPTSPKQARFAAFAEFHGGQNLLLHKSAKPALAETHRKQKFTNYNVYRDLAARPNAGSFFTNDPHMHSARPNYENKQRNIETFARWTNLKNRGPTNARPHKFEKTTTCHCTHTGQSQHIDFPKHCGYLKSRRIRGGDGKTTERRHHGSWNEKRQARTNPKTADRRK